MTSKNESKVSFDVLIAEAQQGLNHLSSNQELLLIHDKELKKTGKSGIWKNANCWRKIILTASKCDRRESVWVYESYVRYTNAGYCSALMEVVSLLREERLEGWGLSSTWVNSISEELPIIVKFNCVYLSFIQCIFIKYTENKKWFHIAQSATQKYTTHNNTR